MVKDIDKLHKLESDLFTKIQWLEDIQEIRQGADFPKLDLEETLKNLLLSFMGNFGCASAFLFTYDSLERKAEFIKRYGGNNDLIKLCLNFISSFYSTNNRVSKNNLVQDLSKLLIDIDVDVDGCISSNFSLMITIPIEKKRNGVILLGHKLNSSNFDIEEIKLISITADLITNTILNNVLTHKIFELQAEVFRVRGTLEQFVSPDIVEKMLNSDMTDNRQGVRKLLTILTLDIRGFTALCELLQPEVTIKFINHFYSSMSDTIFEFGGVVDKFIGDSVMAIFGLFDHSKDVINKSIRCAVKMHSQYEILISSLCNEIPELKKTSIGIGISTGDSVVGHFGSGKRLDYTAIGRKVNLSARLCSAAKGKEILIDEVTSTFIGDSFPKKKLKSIALKGIEDSIDVFAIIY